MKIKTLAAAGAVLSLSAMFASADPLGTAFTYQGKLTDGANAANGIYDFRFTVFDAVTNGSALTGTLTNTPTPVSNGLFTVTLDFGDGIFTGGARWLQLGVRTNHSDSYTSLSPRQPLTPSPYAFWAAAAYSADAVAAANLTGTLLPAQLPANVALLDASQTFSGVNVFNNPLGIGVNPAYTLDAQGGQAVGRFNSTNTGNGSVIELRNSYASAGTLGAINFNDSSSSYPGQIAYYRTNALAFRVAGVNAKMLLNSGGLNVQGALTSGNLFLPATTAGSGIVYFGGNPCVHTYGSSNFFAGPNAGNQTLSGSGNTAVGTSALAADTSGDNNTASGYAALFSNTSGLYNTAIGAEALYSNTNGNYNTVVGGQALAGNTSGAANTAIGFGALGKNRSGTGNIALGDNAGSQLTTENGNIDIGNVGVAGENGTIRIGELAWQTRTFIAGINGATVSGGAAVYVNSAGQLGTLTSSRRFKKDIRDMDAASDALFALRPVTFRYRPEIDQKGTPQFGLVAEEVEKIDPDLVLHDETGKPYTVRYEAVNAMLLNEFLKEHRKVEQLESRLEKLEQLLNAKHEGGQ